MDGLTMDGFKDNSGGALGEGRDLAAKYINVDKTVPEYKTITTPTPELNFTPEQYASLGELLADNYKDLGDKLAKVFGMNSRKVAQALTNAMNNTPDKPKGLI